MYRAIVGGAAVLFVCASFAMFGLPGTAYAAGGSLSGYAWSSNIGWISFSGTGGGSSYGVAISNTDNQTLSGFAWSDGVGWITFNGNSCGAQAMLVNGALQGWAQAMSADNNGWDGCISLSGSGGGSSYGSSIAGGVNKSGTFSGYAWGSDVVGWISFSGTASNGSAYGVSANVIPTASFTTSPSSVVINSGQTSTITATLSVSFPSNITVNYSYSSPDGAVQGTDYTLGNPSPTGSITIPAGQTSATITTLTAGNDASFSANESVVFTPTSGTNYTPGTPGTATITLPGAGTPPFCSLTPSTQTINYGHPATINYSQTSGTSLTFSDGYTFCSGVTYCGGFGHSLGSTGTYSPSPTFSTPYTAAVSGPGGSGIACLSSAAVTVIPPPVITSIVPNSGPVAGGTSITINGSNFTGATGVNFGTGYGGIGLGPSATNVVVVNDNKITATTPAALTTVTFNGTVYIAGPVDVRVTTPSGTSVTGASDVFTYIAPPTCGLSPSSQSIANGNSATPCSLGPGPQRHQFDRHYLSHKLGLIAPHNWLLL